MWSQLSLFDQPNPVGRPSKRAFPISADHYTSHEVVLETEIGTGELKCWAHCPCHGTTPLHLDVFQCSCAGTEATSCRACDLQIEGFLRRLGLALADRGLERWEVGSHRNASSTDDIRAHLLALAVRARRSVDPELAEFTTVACLELRRWWYCALLQRRAEHFALVEFLCARPAMLRIMVWLGATDALALVEQRARVRDIEDVLARRHGVCLWLARRFPEAADPESLMLVGRRKFPRSDLPRDTHERLRWLASVARVVRAVAAYLPEVEACRLDAVAAHASLHYAAMEALDDYDLDRYGQYVERSGRLPPRAHAPERLMLWAEVGMEEFEHDVEDDVPDTWENPALPKHQAPNIVITPIHTKAALIAEARAMRHCVATYATQLAAGTFALYHVDHATGPSTLMLAPVGGKWRIRELKGPFNEPVPAEVTILVSLWLHSQGETRAEAP